MTAMKFKKRSADIITCIAVIGAAAGLCLFPKDMTDSAKDGLYLCFNVIIPSLFPFFVVSSLIIRLGWAEKLGRLLSPVMKPLFNVSGAGASALILGLLGGYPIGAKTAIELYKTASCSKSETERLLAFCNNSGPAFILSVVGAGVFSSVKIGALLYLIHVLSSISVGFIFRKWGSKNGINTRKCKRSQSRSFASAFTDSVKSSFSSALDVCGFVVFFGVFIKLLLLSGVMGALANILGFVLSPLGLNTKGAETLISGMLEVSSGICNLKDTVPGMISGMVMASFMLGSAGLSVHCQVLSLLEGSGLSAKPYFLGKLLHGAIAAVFTLLLTRFLPLSKVTFLSLAPKITQADGSGILSVLRVSVISALVIFVIFAAISVLSSKKGGKSKEKAL